MIGRWHAVPPIFGAYCALMNARKTAFCSVTGDPVGFLALAFSRPSEATSKHLPYALSPSVRSLEGGSPLLLSVIGFIRL